MNKKYYLYGASGHARVIRDIIESSGDEVVAFIDDNFALNERDGLPVVHDAKGLEPIIVAIGNNKVRYNIVKQLENFEFRQTHGPLKTETLKLGVAIHPSAMVSPTAEIGEGTVIMPGAIVNAYAKIGKHCVINTGARVDHECVIGDYVDICPSTTLCGNVRVGDGSNICAGSTVVQGVKIGRWSIVGAGSLVRHDVGDGVVVAGLDLHEIKKNEIIY